MQTLFKWVFLAEPKDNTETGETRKLEKAFGIHNYSKHETHPVPSQINIKCHIKRLILAVLITRYVMTTFNKNLRGILKGKKTTTV